MLEIEVGEHRADVGEEQRSAAQSQKGGEKHLIQLS
jgi:hypothetical protein